MRLRQNSENGLISVEALISLSFFTFTVVTILSIVNICTVQAKVSVAINATAKELSQYSYLYSLTGFGKSEAELAEAAKGTKDQLNGTLANINEVFNQIQNLGDDVGDVSNISSIEDISAKWDNLISDGQKIQENGTKLANEFSEMAKNPTEMIFGIVKLAASEGLELAKSRLVAAPLSKLLCQKHLVDVKNGDVNAYLKRLGVVPAANGVYLDGLDFSKSSLFPYGSNEITVNVSYDVKVIALLPIDFSFHFNQTAVTHGWLAGESTYKSSEETVKNILEKNETLWTQSTTAKERADLIRHQAIADLKKEGYEQVSGLTDVQLYNPSTNEFVMISSMNPLYSAEGEPPMTIADLNDAVLKESIEQLCGKMKSTTNGMTSVKTKKQVNGQNTKVDNNCTDASNKIVLVIPEDEGLKEKMEAIIAESETRGVTIELVPSYGRGARQTAVKASEGDAGEGDV